MDKISDAFDDFIDEFDDGNIIDVEIAGEEVPVFKKLSPLALKFSGHLRNRGINLKKGDKVVVMDLARPEDSLLIASQKGFGKLSDMRYYTRQRRGGKGNLTLRITPKNGKVASAQVVGQESDVYLLTEKAVVQEIPLGEISRYGRVTQGSTLMKLNARDKIASIRAVSPLKVEQPKK